MTKAQRECPTNKTVTLWDIRAHLAALLEVQDDVAPELYEQFAAELQSTAGQQVAKVDATVAMFDELSRLIALRDAEIAVLEKRIERLAESRDVLAGRANNLRISVLRVISATVPKIKGKASVLKGTTAVLAVKGVAPCLGEVDESQVPEAYKEVTCEMPGYLWRRICKELSEVEGREITGKWSVDRNALLDALKSQCPDCGGLGSGPDPDGSGHVEQCGGCNGAGKQLVAGARLEADRVRLVIE